MNLGDTFCLTHLWVVSSLPTPDLSVVVFNFTTWRPGVDENCIAEAGDHPFIKHKSVVLYEQGRLFSPDHLAKTLALPECSERAPVSPALLARIQAGALKSDLTKQKYQAIIEDSMARQKP